MQHSIFRVIPWKFDTMFLRPSPKRLVCFFFFFFFVNLRDSDLNTTSQKCLDWKWANIGGKWEISQGHASLTYNNTMPTPLNYTKFRHKPKKAYCVGTTANYRLNRLSIIASSQCQWYPTPSGQNSKEWVRYAMIAFQGGKSTCLNDNRAPRGTTSTTRPWNMEYGTWNMEI